MRPTVFSVWRVMRALTVVVVAVLGACGPAAEDGVPREAVPTAPAPEISRTPAPRATKPAAPRGRGRLTIDVTRDGAPAPADVRLTPPPVEADELLEPWWTVAPTLVPRESHAVPPTTDAPGRHVSDGLAAGRYLVSATAADGAMAEASVVLGHDADHVTVALRLVPAQRTAEIRGRVIGPDGKPFRGLVGIGVWQSAQFSFEFHPAAWKPTADDGTFTLVAPLRARVAVSALVPGELRVRGQAVVTPCAEEYVLDLSRETAEVAVHVFDEESGKKLPGVSVSAYSSHGRVTSQSRTGVDGRCAVRSGTTGVLLTVEAAGYPPVGALDVAAAERAVEVPLRAGPGLRVHVVRVSDGTPAPGVPVFVREFGEGGVNGSGAPQTTGPDGVATFRGLQPGPVFVFALGAGWISEGMELGRVVGDGSLLNARRPRRPPDVLPPSGVADVHLRVLPAGVVTGRVTRADGSPVAGAVISARAASMVPYVGSVPGQDEADISGPPAVSASDGSFRLDGLAPHARYSVRASAEGEAGTPSQEYVTPGASDVVLRFAVPHVAEVLVVDDASGAPVRGAEVVCVATPVEGEWTSRRHVASATSGPYGTARIGPVVAGSWDVTARAPGRVPSSAQTFTATDEGPAPSRVVLRLTAAGRIRGRVRMLEGAMPEFGFAVVADDDPKNRRRGKFWSDDERFEGAIGRDGTFEIEGVPPGSHTLRAEVDGIGGAHFAGQVQTQTGGTECVLDVEPAERAEEAGSDGPATFAVRVVGPDGAPVGAASILASWTEDGLSQETTFDVTRGVARLPLASRGTTVTVHSAGSLNGIRLDTATLRAALPPDATDGFELRLATGVSISGRIEDGKGRPVPGVPVFAFEHKAAGAPFAWSRGASLAADVSGADGAFTLRGLDRAEYEVAVEPPFDCEPIDDVVVLGGAQGIVLQTERGAPNVVRVLDPDGAPVAGAQVEVRKLAPGMHDEIAAAESGPDGLAVLPALVRGREVRLQVRSWGRDLETWSGAWTPAPETTVTLPRLASVSGRVVLPDGSPAADVSVWWRESLTRTPERRSFFGGGVWIRVRTGADGHFTIPGVPVAAIDVVAGDYDSFEGGHQDSPRLDVGDSLLGGAVVRLPSGTKDATLRLAAERIVRIRLTGLRGPVPEADRPRLSWGHESLTLRSVATADPSVFLWSGVLPGREYEVVVRIPVQNVVGRLTGVRAGETVELAVSEGATLEGRVISPEGAEWDTLNVSFDAGGFHVRYESGKDARVLIPCLPQIEGELRVWTYPDLPPENPGCQATLRATPGVPVEVRLTRGE